MPEQRILSQHPSLARIEQVRSELAQCLKDCPDDSAAIEILREFYRGRIRSGLGASDYPWLLSDTAEAVLHHVCDRLQRHSGFAEIDFSLIAIGAFAQRLMGPTGTWPVLAIYRQSDRQTRSLSRPTLQQIAERFLDRLCEWIDRITDGTNRLSWPLVIESVPVFSKRVAHLRDWLDALPSHATALHAPMLSGARFVGGEPKLCQRLIDESASILRQPFQTEVDVAYLSGYFGSALREFKSSIESLFAEDRVRNTRALEALVSIEQVARLSEPFVGGLQAFRQRWMDTQATSKAIDQADVDDFCRSAKEWFERRFQTELIESKLAQAILLGGSGPTPIESYEELSAFGSPEEAFGLLLELAREEIQVLSSRNCRYHLAKIVERLVGQIAKTPSPELTLRNCVSIGRSLGGKGVLWELFSSHALLLELYTRLCGTSPYLVQILLSNPGMIDDLLDSLMLERIPDYQGFQSALDALCKGSQEIESVVIAFRNAMHLAIGVRDILGRENITEIHRALADVHEVCLSQVALAAHRFVASKYPQPRGADGKPVEMATMVIGKLASREPNYHSDVTMLVLVDSMQASHGVFFQQVAQRMIQMANRVTRFGRLFELNSWLFQGDR
ncbi:MAG: hypothetical protein ACKOAH_29775, partial [Pirellula sp.]